MAAAPPALVAAIADLAGTIGTRRLAAHVQWWQRRYRNPDADLAGARPLDRDRAAAYAVYRMLATYAAVRAALGELAAADPALRLRLCTRDDGLVTSR